jgi:cytidine deaminase
MKPHEIAPEDRELLDAAADVLRRNYREPLHTVGAAVRCWSGKIYAAVNVDSVGYGPRAEPIALGMAISGGEREFKTITAVGNDGSPRAPCGNCRQLLLEYAPVVDVLLSRGDGIVKVPIAKLLPEAYSRPGS